VGTKSLNRLGKPRIMAMDITLATFDHAPETALRGVRFNNTWVPSETYADSRRGTLTGQYPQRQATTRISEIFAGVGYEVREDTQPAGSDVFRLLEQPSLEELNDVNGVIAVCSLLGGNSPMSVLWPGVAESGENNELVSPIDLAPTLAAIAGLDVRPNAQLSFDGLNLVPVLRHGASGHAALFFDNGVRMIDASLIDDTATPPHERARLQDEWETWNKFITLGPLQ